VLLNLVVWGDPVPQGSKRAFVVTGRDGRPRPVVAESAGPALRSWRSDLVEQARAALGEAGPSLGPLAVTVVFHLRRPKRPRSAEPERRPDLDKLVRAVLDGLQTAGVFRDDAQVVSLWGRKRYADETPRTEIWVGPWRAVGAEEGGEG